MRLRPHAITSVSGKNWSYSYDPNGNMTTRSENGTAYTQEFNAENKVERVVALEDADFSDQFDTKDTNAWAYNSYQTVPFNLSGHGNVVKNVGTGNDYAANFRRKSYNLTSGESVQFEFRVTESNSNATFAVETSGSWDVDYNRWGLRARNDKITIHYRTGGVTIQSVTLIDDLETDTWYVATLVMDDGNGFYLHIHEKDDPSIQGSYHFDGMPAGKSWRFRHWIKYGTSYVDNYSEQPASQTAFVYDGDGNRVKRQEGGVTTYYVGGCYEKQGSTVTKYYTFGSQRVAMRKGSTLTYLHGDHLGSTSLATYGTSGAKVSRVLYYPYGETRYTEGTLPTDFKYTGQREEDGLGGLYDYHARYYDPYLNRFISADTMVPNPANPQDLNRYAYTRNNPVRYTDPSGHYIFEEDPNDPWNYSDSRVRSKHYFTHPEYAASTISDAEAFTALTSVFWVPAGVALITELGGIALEAGEALYWEAGKWYIRAQVAARAGITGLLAKIIGTELSDGDNDEVQALEGLRRLRSAYENEVRQIGEEAQRRLGEGQSPEEVARWAHQARRALGETYKSMTPPHLLEQIYARNIEKYGDPLGPSIEWLLERGKAWMDIIESAGRPGGEDITRSLLESAE